MTPDCGAASGVAWESAKSRAVAAASGLVLGFARVAVTTVTVALLAIAVVSNVLLLWCEMSVLFWRGVVVRLRAPK